MTFTERIENRMKKGKALSVIAIFLALFWCLLQSCLVTVTSESDRETEGRGIPNFVKLTVGKGNELHYDDVMLSVENRGFWVLVLLPSLLFFLGGYLWASSNNNCEPGEVVNASAAAGKSENHLND